jgi:hypothetical protein
LLYADLRHARLAPVPTTRRLIWLHPGWRGRSPHRHVLAACADEALELVDLTDRHIT